MEFSKKSLKEKIDSFERWHYQFDLRGLKTPIVDHSKINRHRQRREYIMQPILSLFGGSLQGKKVLDLGCNAGFWSLQVLKNGCDFVLGIDGRQMHIEQAQLVLSENDIDSTSFKLLCGDVFELDFEDFGQFDIVLCLGLMYHVNQPVQLLQKISSINSNLLVLDTIISGDAECSFQLKYEDVSDPRMAVKESSVLVPSLEALLSLGEHFNYNGRKVLQPDFSSYEGAMGYETGMRKAILFSKKRDFLF